MAAMLWLIIIMRMAVICLAILVISDWQAGQIGHPGVRLPMKMEFGTQRWRQQQGQRQQPEQDGSKGAHAAITGSVPDIGQGDEKCSNHECG